MNTSTFDLLVFDLDGTLVDAFEDITHAVNAAMVAYNQPPHSVEEVTACVGHGVRVLMERIVADRDIPVDDALAIMRDYYDRHPADTARLYPGVADTMATLHRDGFKLAVLSNKVESITKDVVAHLGLAPYLSLVFGETGAYPRKPAPDGLLALIDKSNCRPERTLMVGDNDTDCDVASAASCSFCAVTYGAKEREHWRNRGVVRIIDRFEELLRVVARE
jgi:phosphoglycolate phosphatase